MALGWAPLAWWARQGWFEPSARVASTLILLVAVFWVIERMGGG